MLGDGLFLRELFLGNGDGSLDVELLSEEDWDADDDDETKCTTDRGRVADFAGLQVSYDAFIFGQLKLLRDVAVVAVVMPEVDGSSSSSLESMS